MDLDKATRTQIENVQSRTGKSLDQLFAILKNCGLEKFGQMRDHLKKEHGMGHGDANLVVTLFNQQGSGSAATSVESDPLDALYAGAKEHLRPIHEKLMTNIRKFGAFEIAPKKTYVSLRRKKQFAMIGPATKSRVEVGLNMKDVDATDRLKALPPGGMCQFRVDVADPSEVDRELIAWIKKAYDSAG